jgi:hypothetical protein
VSAHDRDLKPVEDPSDAKPDDDEKVKAAAGQTVEAKRDIRADRGRGFNGLLHSGTTSDRSRDSGGATRSKDEPEIQPARRD